MEDRQLDSEQSQETISALDPNQVEQQSQNPSLSSALPPEVTHEQVGNKQQDTIPSDAREMGETESANGIEYLMHEMQRLRQDFETKVQYDASKERTIDTLHEELQTYREGLHYKILRPLFMDLISMHDDLDHILEDIIVKENGNSHTMLRNLQSFQASIEETLRRYEVETFSVEGDTLVSGKQRILKVIEVGDAAQDRHIARRVRKGFEYEGRLLRPEIVDIYRFNANLQVKEAKV